MTTKYLAIDLVSDESDATLFDGNKAARGLGEAIEGTQGFQKALAYNDRSHIDLEKWVVMVSTAKPDGKDYDTPRFVRLRESSEPALASRIDEIEAEKNALLEELVGATTFPAGIVT